ncbi:MAG: hypothetical protein SNG14_01700 [Rikenellaceae bacterium]
MDYQESQFLANYEDKLLRDLLRQVTDVGALEGELLAAEELEERWITSAPEYMAAAVPEIAKYPTVAIAWAAYVGIGAAVLWDTDWESYEDEEDLYSLLAAPRGFDCLDEYVMQGLLGYALGGKDAERLESILRGAAETALVAIRKEEIEPQSVMAFHIFAHTAKVFYKLGVAIGLRLQGYRYEKVTLEQN